jgi:hydroxymethylbilane synthase
MGSERHLRIGTRKSRLALVQAEQVRSAVIQQYPEWTTELVLITTRGDQFMDMPIAALEGKGVFLKELEEALVNSGIDCAVHSMKDVPNEINPELRIDIVTRREDPHDGLIAHNKLLTELPAGSLIGTGSSRRMFQLLSFRPELEVKPVRGNVDTRIRKWQDGQFDALVLAMAGIRRMQLEHLVTEIIPYTTMLPAAGQGALGVELRAGDGELQEQLAFLDDPETHAAVESERAFLTEIGGGCQVPIGVYGEAQGNGLYLMARIIDEATGRVTEGNASGTIDDRLAMGKHLARQLMKNKQ